MNPAVTRLFAMTENVLTSANSIANSRPGLVEVLFRAHVRIRDDRVAEETAVREKLRGHLWDQTDIYRRPDIIYFRRRPGPMDLKAGL